VKITYVKGVKVSYLMFTVYKQRSKLCCGCGHVFAGRYGHSPMLYDHTNDFD